MTEDEVKESLKRFYYKHSYLSGDYALIDTCLDRFKKGELNSLAYMHKKALIDHIERTHTWGIMNWDRKGYERFIKACSSAKGRI